MGIVSGGIGGKVRGDVGASDTVVAGGGGGDFGVGEAAKTSITGTGRGFEGGFEEVTEVTTAEVGLA